MGLGRGPLADLFHEGTCGADRPSKSCLCLSEGQGEMVMAQDSAFTPAWQPKPDRSDSQKGSSRAYCDVSLKGP